MALPSQNRVIGLANSLGNVQQARVYALTQHDAKYAPNVIMGTPYISN